MERFLIAGVLILVAVAVAAVLRRRQPEPPTQPTWDAPTQLDRGDFAGTDVPWLVAVFTSATCDSCAAAVAKAEVLRSADVAVQVIPWQDHRDLHGRYHIEAVPTIVIAGTDGAVRASFVGTPTATDLWAAVAEIREPGSSPEPDLGR